MARKTPITAGVDPDQLEWMDRQPEANAELVRRGIEKLRQSEK
jgi:hypothetical protein